MQQTDILSKIDDDGMTLRLIGGSSWGLSNVGDYTKTICWLAAARINISEHDDGYKMTNLDSSDESVEVVKI